MTFYFALFIFNYSKTPATHYLTRRNRFIAFIWNHISSFLLQKNTRIRIFFPQCLLYLFDSAAFKKESASEMHAFFVIAKNAQLSEILSTFNSAERKSGPMGEIKHQICRVAVTRLVPVTVSAMHSFPEMPHLVFKCTMGNAQMAAEGVCKTADDSMKRNFTNGLILKNKK